MKFSLRVYLPTLFLSLFLSLPAQATPPDHAIPLSAEQSAHLGVRVIQPEAVDALPLARVPGRVVLPPAREFVVSAPQSGLIVRVHVPLGVAVKQGQTLAEMRSVELLGAQRELLDASTEFGLAEARLKRDRTLLEEGVISQLRQQETQSAWDKAHFALLAAQQTLAAYGLSQSDIQRLAREHRLDSRMEIRAPSAGIVLERLAVIGQRVETLAPLFRIGQLDELWLELDMPQERLHEIAGGDRVTLENPKATARIIEIGQNVNPDNQSALVRAKVEGEGRDLRPGMHVNVQLLHNSADRIFRVPVAAVVSHEGHSYVFVRTPQGYAAREVAVAGQEAHHAVIHEGLAPGEEVAVQGVAGLKSTWLGVGEGHE